MADLPCRNPECTSYGQIHPHCKCYSGMAEGGEASFCAEARHHDPSCQYFQDGGEVFDPASVTVSPEEEEFNPASVQITPDAAPEEEFDPASVVVQADTPPDPNFKPGPETPIPSAEDQGAFIDQLKGEHQGRVMQDIAGSAPMLAGTQLAAGAGEKAAAWAATKGLGERGAAALREAITLGGMEGLDQTQKALAGGGNPEDAVNPYLATGAMTLLGAAFGAGGAKIGRVLGNALEDRVVPMMEKAEKWLSGFGLAASGEELAAKADKHLKNGYEAYKKIPGQIVDKAASMALSKGHKKLGIITTLAADMIAPAVGLPVNIVGKYTAPTIVRWISQGGQASLFNMIDYADKVAKGTSLINNSIEALFAAGAKHYLDDPKDTDVSKLKKHVDEGGMNSVTHDAAQEMPQGFAHGGKVEHPLHAVHADHHLAQVMPEQNMLIQEAKGRVSNYLSSLKPENHFAPRLAFDDAPNDHEQKKTYDRAIHVALQPLSVLKRVGDGTLLPEHIQHLDGMYPGLKGHLQQKIVQRITEDQLKGKKPSYKVRQGLSLLLGAPLSGELTPQAIQAAQSVFRAQDQGASGSQQSGTQPRQPSQKSTDHLSKSDRSYLTDGQARVARGQRTT